MCQLTATEACCPDRSLLCAAEAAAPTATGETSAKKKPAKARKKATPAVKDEPSMSDSSVEAVEVVGQASVKYVKKPYKRRKFDNELTTRLLAAAKAALAAPETGQASSCSMACHYRRVAVRQAICSSV